MARFLARTGGAAALMLLAGLAAPRNADAGPFWGPRGAGLTADEFDQAFPTICATPDGQLLVAWQQLGRIRVQKLTRQGAVALPWPQAVGVELTPDSEPRPYQQCGPRICSDGAGGAFVVWNDGRASGCGISCFVQDCELYLQHVTALGAVDPSWSGEGLRVGSLPAPTAFTGGSRRIRPQDPHPELAPDGQGGVILAWLEWRPFSSDTVPIVRAQRFAANGTRLWAMGGVAAATGPGARRYPELWPDGEGGACLLWEARGAADSTFTLRGQHVSADGVASWGPDGRSMASEAAGNADHRIAYERSIGAFVIWSATSAGRTRVMAKHFSIDGGAIDAEATTLTDSAATTPQPRIASGVTGDVWATWLAPSIAGGGVVVARLSSYAKRPLATRVSFGDTIAVPKSEPRVAVDAYGAAIATWLEGSFALRVGHVSAAGALGRHGESSDGTFVDAADGDVNELIAGDGGQAFVAWGRRREFPNANDEVRVQALCSDGEGAPCDAAARTIQVAGDLRLDHIVPVPAHDAIEIGYELRSEAEVEAELLDLAGRRLVHEHVGRMSAGPHSVRWSSQLPGRPGTYFVRLRTSAGAVSCVVILIR